jgi:hypothetical protein
LHPAAEEDKREGKGGLKTEKTLKKIKAKKVLEKRKRFLPLQTQTEGSPKEEKK